MVDVVVNNVMGLDTDLSDLSTYMFKDKASLLPLRYMRVPDPAIRLQSLYHPYCPIQWGNSASEQNCWLGDTNVTLPDINTQDPSVVSAYTTWIKALVTEFNIDGLRIDGKSADIAYMR